MKYKTLFLLITCYFIYLLLGALVFYVLEFSEAQNQCDKAKSFFMKLNQTYSYENLTDMIEEIYKFHQYGIQFRDGEVLCQENWDYSSCIFFAGTIITTIGYGHLVPSTPQSKAFCVVFALIGIPIFTIMFSALGDIFGHYMQLFMNRMERWSDNKDGFNKKKKKKHAWILLFVFGSLGFILFCLFPSIIFSSVEKWNLSDSLYFTIITLTTVGFGDFVPGSQTTEVYRPIYRIMVYIWILLGLAYTATFLKVISLYLIKRAEEIFKKKPSPDTNSSNSVSNEEVESREILEDEKLNQVDVVSSTQHNNDIYEV